MAAKELQIGHAAPSYHGAVGEDETVTNADFAGRNVVLFFYPKDATSG